jgi:hypothetical protein
MRGGAWLLVASNKS